MTGKLIAFVDGSIYSRSVAEHAAWIAGRMAVSVELFHILGRREATKGGDLTGSIRLGARTALLDELAALDEQRAKLIGHRGRAILDDARAILSEAGINEITTRLRHGDLMETVAEQEKDAAMILIGKRGEAADFAKLHLGSNLERVIRASHRPVFVAARAFRPIDKVMIAYDGNPSAMRAVEHVAQNPMFAGLETQLVMVGTQNSDTTQRLEAARARLRAGGINAESRILTGQAEDALSKCIEEEGFNLLVMGAYGHSRIRSLIIGSTTTEMIRTCKVSLTLVR